nr:phage-related protein tail component-like protein [uncultured Mediterranean phage uvMED]BAR26006.1 phage-related protein tail component-like protein [uncultured Mediterranean phage uvMED]BAR26029.1 phage-related protein tail component-like protein [uncultured Mediterranean phage uvMED]BAR26056.1 phage-related protein tail component-like protein [uncultured Mediterranean phage uvMED]BAR26072.1 phage-related protein tail component-like protein [uncultured Mediterranean phage uvMED]
MALNSKTTLKIIDALCEGPIEGLVKARRSVFLNETLITGRQFVDKTVQYSTKPGVRSQRTFNAGSTFQDRQTTIINVNEQIGSSYSETLNAAGTLRKGDPDYGTGQTIRTITDVDVDFVELVFTIPKLYCVAVEGLARGQLFFAQIKLNLHICGADGVWNKVNIEVENQANKNVIKGICTSSYQFKTQPIDLTKKKYGKGPYRIRVRKIEFDNPENAFEISFNDFVDIPERTPIASKRADQIFWTSIIVGKKFGTAYPHTALVFLSLDSEEYSTLPARAYDVKGLKVKIPSNATVQKSGRLKFDDVPFDGSLRTDKFWTTCPVCCFYDLLTNKRYGAGDFINQSNLNWVDLIEIAKYCNEQVEYVDDQGETRKEARFAINTVIGSQAEAFSVLQDMASVFRGMLFWKSDNVQIAADHGELDGGDVPAIHVFSNSNVVNGSFSYSGSSLKTRSTRVRVRYNDPDNFHKPNFICIEDRTLIDKYGVQEKSVVAFGCTSKYQAQRMGRWIMQSEKLHDETVTFSVGLEGLNVLPGQVFEVSDEMRFGTRLAGRIVGVSNDSTPPFVRIDQTASLPSVSGNKLTVVLKDGTLETKDILNVSGDEVRLTSSYTQIPPDDALYAIKSDSAVLSKYRCLSVAEGEEGTYAVVGVKHVDGIYTVVESASSNLDLAATSIYGSEPDAPTDIKITFQQIDDGRNTTNRATVSWTRGLSGPVIAFKVRYKVGDGGNWINQITNNNSIDISTGLVPGKLLIVQIKAVGPEPDRKESAYSALFSREIPVGGTSDDTSDLAQVTLPPDPEDVSIEAIGVDQVALRWGATASGQKLEAFVAVIKHSSKTDGTGSWSNSTVLRKVEARTTSVVLPLLNGEYLIKFQNEQNLRSANAVSALINIPDGIPRLNHEVIREDQLANEFGGDKAGVYYSQDYDGLILDGDASFDAISSLDGFTANIDSHFGTQLVRGEYFFQKTVDLGSKFSVRMQRVLTARGLYTSALIDDRSELIDTWSDFDGDLPDDTNVEVYFRKSDLAATVSDFVNEDGTDKILYEDNSNIEQNSDLVFDDWIPLENNAYMGRTFQFKAVLTTDHVDQTPIVDQLGVTLQFERRTENSGTIASGATSKAVLFENAFYTDADTEVAVGITAFNLQSGDYYRLTSVTGTGFTITFYNSSDTVIDRDFQYTAIGYGTQQS